MDPDELKSWLRAFAEYLARNAIVVSEDDTTGVVEDFCDQDADFQALLENPAD